MSLVRRPRKHARHDGASDVCRRRHRLKRIVAASAVALVIVGGGANEIGAPAIAGAVTNIGLAHHHHAWGLTAFSRCTVWTLIDDSTENGLAIESFVFFRATAGPSAIYVRRCGSNYQYSYVDTGNGRVSCLTAPVPAGLPSCESTDYVDIVLDRCR